MSEALAILGYVVIGSAAFALLALAIRGVLVDRRHDEAVADAASGMDEFSAPEGGQQR